MEKTKIKLDLFKDRNWLLALAISCFISVFFILGFACGANNWFGAESQTEVIAYEEIKVNLNEMNYRTTSDVLSEHNNNDLMPSTYRFSNKIIKVPIDIQKQILDLYSKNYPKEMGGCLDYELDGDNIKITKLSVAATDISNQTERSVMIGCFDNQITLHSHPDIKPNNCYPSDADFESADAARSADVVYCAYVNPTNYADRILVFYGDIEYLNG